MGDEEFLPTTHERCLDAYFKEINNYPLLTQDEEIKLAQRIKRGDEEALQNLARSNLRFVVSVAKRYMNQGLLLSDLINEGNIGLIRAAHRFDEERGFRFISYAVWWIRQAITQALNDQARTVRLPPSQTALLRKIKRTRFELEDQGITNPTPELIAEKLDIPLHKIQVAVQAGGGIIRINDEGKEGDQRPLEETLEAEDQASPDQTLLEDSMRNHLWHVLSALTEREAEVITRYYGLGFEEAQTLQNIGEIMGLTRERIRQIKEQALERMRELVTQEQV